MKAKMQLISIYISFIGKYCKIVTKESDEESPHVVIGTVKDVDHNDGFLLVNSCSDPNESIKRRI